MVVVRVELALLLLTVQRHVGGVDVEHDLLGRRFVRSDELRNEHFVQRPCLRACGPILQATEGGRGRQRRDTADGRLHQRIGAQYIVIVQVLVAAAHRVQALSEQVVQAMFDALGIACIADRCGRCAAQPDASIDLAQEHQPAVGTQLAAVECRLDDAPAQPPKLHPALGTIWHRRISSADLH